MNILDRHDPVDINERVSTWRQSGWTGFDPDADQTGLREPTISRTDFAREPSVGSTRNPASENLHAGTYPTAQSEERQTGHSATGNYTNGGSLSQSQVGGGSTSHDDTRSWRATSSASAVDTFKPAFRIHYQENFANTSYGYEQFEPAYLYGYTLANDSRFENRDWRDIEPDARIYWNTYHADSPWEEFKGAIRQGWQEVKQAVTR